MTIGVPRFFGRSDLTRVWVSSVVDRTGGHGTALGNARPTPSHRRSRRALQRRRGHLGARHAAGAQPAWRRAGRAGAALASRSVEGAHLRAVRAARAADLGMGGLPAHPRPARAQTPDRGSAPRSEASPQTLLRQITAQQYCRGMARNLLKLWPALWTFAAAAGVQ